MPQPKQFASDGSFGIGTSKPTKVVDAKKSFSRVERRRLEAHIDDDGELVVVDQKMLKELEKFLKLSNSVKFEFVPANDWYQDKKGFKWEVGSYNEAGVGFSIKFDHPKYISVGGTDTMKISFFNTAKYLSPSEEGMMPIPDGFTMTIKLPPQGE